ncbi:MAG: tRNA lysidine(34) synthetase TilS [Acidobacteria bacterium]|nr:tRNA lysidine(34) synthetase TilS [Acidobacteriota bacterium]
MDALIRTLARTIRAGGLVPAGGRVVAAHSGGADSTALVHLLHALAPELGFSLETLHVNHGLRGADADADAAFCAETARRLGVPFHLEVLDPATLPTANVEEALRDRRREIYRRHLADSRARVALGHTRDDQAETFLLRLLRGAGLEGLAAMAPSEGGLIRPLLAIPRERLLRYLGDHGIPFRRDLSNDDPRYTRNRLRREVLPPVERLFPSAGALIARAAATLRQEWEALRALAADRAAALLRTGDGPPGFDNRELERLPPALRPTVVREVLRAVRGDLRRLTSAHVGQVLAFASRAPGGKRLALPGLGLFKSGHRVVFGPVAQPLEPFEHVLPVPGRVRVPETGETFGCALEAGGGGEQVEVPLPGGAPALTVRNGRPGDTIRLACGAKKLKKLFQEARVPVERRSRVTLVCGPGGEIVWIPELKRKLWYNDFGFKTIFLERES